MVVVVVMMLVEVMVMVAVYSNFVYYTFMELYGFDMMWMSMSNIQVNNLLFLLLSLTLFEPTINYVNSL